jgi:hypothetical protein
MRRLLSALGVSTVLVSGFSAGSVVMAGTAGAAPCGVPVADGSDCTLTGTVTLTGGTLTLTSPSSLTWIGTLTGLSQSLVDVLPTDEQYTVTDATGSAAGWNVTTSATTFTSGANTFPDAGTFVTNGSTASVTSTAGPSATCTTGPANCVAPANTTTYPVAITTAPVAPTPSVIYDTSAGTGIGQFTIGFPGANPVGWWVNVPATAIAGVYTSTVTMQIISGP